MLSEFFASNSGDSSEFSYLYNEYAEHFIWDAKNKYWKPRKRGVVIGRVAHSSPAEGERYYLRLLLGHVRGPKSFDDLKTVGGQVCATFQEAALKRGLLEGDDVAHRCMDEAMMVDMPNALRRLFATILFFNCPNNPGEFWDKYYKALSEDYANEFPLEKQRVLELTASRVERFMEGMGKNFASYNMDHLHNIQDSYIRNTRDVRDAYDAPVPEEQFASRKKLNAAQKEAYRAIIKNVSDGNGGAYFIDGPGGTYKTFLYRALYAKVRSMDKICLPTATSGIAASNLSAGRTAHSVRVHRPVGLTLLPITQALWDFRT